MRKTTAEKHVVSAYEGNECLCKYKASVPPWDIEIKAIILGQDKGG